MRINYAARGLTVAACWLTISLWGAPLEPYSLMGTADGKSANAAQTQDVGASIDDILEHDRLVDTNGVTACDKYFGWGGIVKDQSESQKILCGKYQFMYEHWSTVGMPQNLLTFNEKWYGDFFGDEYSKLGYFPNTNPRRVVTDVVPIAQGQCLAEVEQCSGILWWRSCEMVCTQTAAEDTWTEVFEVVADDQLPVGFQIGPKKAFGFDSAAFTCAGCHLGKLEDGRFAVGMANQNLNYGQVIAGFMTPMQATLSGLMTLMNDPIVDDAMTEIVNVVPELGDMLGMMDTLQMHPGMQFNDPSTEFAFAGSAMETMMDDLKVGTCYYKANGEFLRCDHHNENHGLADNQAKAADMRAYLEDRYGNITYEDWPMAMAATFGDTYCLPWPLTPSSLGGSNSQDWSWFTLHLLPSNTLQSMADNCAGTRWNAEFWLDFIDTMVSMMSGDIGGTAFPGLSEQDMFINAGFNVLDFLEAPMSDDHVWTLSKIANVVGISTQAEIAAHPGMRTAAGDHTNYLALAGGAGDLATFVKGFVLLSQSIDPRYVECETPGIVGNWDAKPDETCTVPDATVAPIAAYIESLRTPHISGTGSSEISHGKEVFATNCEDCHNGPKAETPGVFVFGDLANEGLANIPTCAVGQLSVEWAGSPPVATTNECQPAYDTTHSVKYIGVVGTDPTYSQLGGPNPTTGIPEHSPELATFQGGISQAVKGQRLTGVGYKAELFHHGQLKNLDEVLCATGSKRATPADRAVEVCMVYDMESEAGLAAYKDGNPICLQTWRPYQGHEFGCGLTASDKSDLIDYLSTL